MDNIKLIFKPYWLQISLSIGLITLAIIIFQQNKKIKRLNTAFSRLEYKISDLENENKELQNELDDCNAEKDNNESQSSNKSSNWSLQNNNYDLERKIRDLEDELTIAEVVKLQNMDFSDAQDFLGTKKYFYNTKTDNMAYESIDMPLEYRFNNDKNSFYKTTSRSGDNISVTLITENYSTYSILKNQVKGMGIKQKGNISNTANENYNKLISIKYADEKYIYEFINGEAKGSNQTIYFIKISPAS